MQIRIEVDLFSGRPNPAWSPDDATRHQLQSLLAGARDRVDGQSPALGLGSRGFVITIVDGVGERRYRVFQGTIEFGGQRFRDPGGSIETLIRASLPSTLRAEYADLL